METRTIKQIVIFKASPHDVYEALMDSKKHARFTHSKADISKKVGGKISAYDGYIDGKNIELVQDKKIVQSWHASDWPAGHYSKATFLLNKVKEGTRLIFTQENVAEEFYTDIDKGWKEHYWQPLKELLEQEE